MIETIFVALVVIVTVPVFAFSAYTAALLAASIRYKEPTPGALVLDSHASVSVLLAVYNEAGVVEETLEALSGVDYPPANLQVIIADDSDDATKAVVDEWAQALRGSGIDARVSRRDGRQGFKAGALNAASGLLTGDFVLLIDADSRVGPKVVRRAVDVLRDGPLSFVSFRVGHYNRDATLVTRAFALFQDTIDSLQKMGATALSVPFSVQGGFVLVKRDALARVGFWKEGILAEDADLSCRLFSAGFKGAYLSSCEIPSEDPSALRVWKRQAARVAQGWAQCLRANFRSIVSSSQLDPLRKTLLLLTMLSPFAARTWLAVTLGSAILIVSRTVDPASSVFSNPVYVFAVTLPVVVFYLAGTRALWMRRILGLRNLAVLPALSYMITSMFTLSAISFASGLLGRRGDFFRTPKGGHRSQADAQRGEGLWTVFLEGGLSIAAVVLSLPVFISGAPFLGLSLVGFGLATLKSMDLSRFVSKGGLSNGGTGGGRQ